MKEKANDLLDYLDLIVEQSKEHGKDLASKVITKVAKYVGLVVHKCEEFLLLPEEVAVLRDCVGTSTSGIDGLKSVLEALHPNIRGLLIPSCIRAVLARVDGSDNFEVKTVECQCIITKDGSIKGMRPFAYIVRPWELVKQIVEKIKVEGVYQPSQD